jgi:hypothetical protein
MTDTTALIAAAVARMQHNRKLPFSGEWYETSFIAGYRYFAEPMACLVGHRINAAIFGDGTEIGDLGEFVRESKRVIMGQPGTDVLDILTELDADGDPRFMMQVSKTRKKGDDGDMEEHVSIKVLENYKPSSGLRGYQNTVMEASLDYHEEWIIGIGTTLQDDFRSFTAFSDALKTALPHRADQLAGKDERRYPIDASYKALADADGGLPGPITSAAVDEYFLVTSRHVSDWAARRIQEIVANQTERGFAWGEKYLNFNDLDDSCCAVPTEVEGRSALFHENTSLINDYRSYIAWVDTNEDGTTRSLSVRMISSEENTGQVIDAFRNGDASPTLSMDFASREVYLADNYLDTNLLGTFAFYLRVDDKLYVGGEMDGEDREDCNVHTDFSDFYISADDEFDDDEDTSENAAGM